jgi:acetoin utilization deacetylase AcuC-like enzyme
VIIKYLISFGNQNLIESYSPSLCCIRVHEYTYLNHLEAKCHLAYSNGRSTEGGINSNLDSVEQQKIPYFYAPTGNLDVDTPLVAKSLTASRMFCGSVPP